MSKNIGRVLLFCPEFYDYHKSIIHQLESIGFEVIFIRSNSNNVLLKNSALSRLHRFIFQEKHEYRILQIRNKQILKEIKRIDTNIDYVIVLGGGDIQSQLLRSMKIKFVKAKFILYLWDSLKNADIKPVFPYYDRIFSFDYEDCRNNSLLSYLPMFCTNEIEQFLIENNNYLEIDIKFENDIYSFGSFHPKRFDKMLNIFKYCKTNNIICNFNLKSSGVIILKYLFLPKEIKLFYRPKVFSQYSKEYLRSKSILDITSENQTGLSPRIIEALILGKKIVTNNPNIICEQFYDDSNIFVLNDSNISLLKDFLCKPVKKYINPESYSTKSFIENLLNESPPKSRSPSCLT